MSGIWGLCFKELRWLLLQLPSPVSVFGLVPLPVGSSSWQDVSGLWHHQHLGVYKLSPGFIFIALHRSFLGPPCKDYHPDTCFLSSAALQHHGRRFHDFLNLSCLQIQYHVQDITMFFSATCLGWRLATLDHSCSSFSMLELVGKCPRKLLSRRRKLLRLSPFPG